jgi:uncharacterized protein
VRRLELVAAAATAMGVAGCASSPPIRYYTLAEAPATDRLAAPDNTVPVRLDRVTIPTELDRAQLVRRVDATRLQILDNDRWAAPLDETIRRVLSNNLAARLPPGMVADPNEPSFGVKRQLLSVDFSDFYGDSSCAVTLRAAWVVKSVDSQSASETVETKVLPSGGCAGASTLPTVMSQALGQLSDRIAASLIHASGS